MMKLPKLSRVTRIEGVEEPEMRGRFSEIIIADGAREVRLSCDPDTDELRIARGSKRKRRGIVLLVSGRFKVEWFWTMTNQQGYSDGFRLQLRSKVGFRVFDFVSGGSGVDVFEALKVPNQPPQRNAGSRPSSGDSSASETPSSRGPRG